MKICISAFLIVSACYTCITYLEGAVTKIDCGYACELKENDTYAISCAATGLVSNLQFNHGNTTALSCSRSGSCSNEEPGYAGNGTVNVSPQVYKLYIQAFKQAKDTSWECRDGASTSTCDINILDPPTLAPPTGIQGNCSMSGDKFVIWCSGLATFGSPAAELKLQAGSDVKSITASSIMLTTEMKDSLAYKCYIDGPATKCLNIESTIFEGACPGVSKLSDGAIAGIAVGAIATVAIICVIIVCVVKHFGKC